MNYRDGIRRLDPGAPSPTYQDWQDYLKLCREAKEYQIQQSATQRPSSAPLAAAPPSVIDPILARGDEWYPAPPAGNGEHESETKSDEEEPDQGRGVARIICAKDAKLDKNQNTVKTLGNTRY